MVSTDHQTAAPQPSGASFAATLVAFIWRPGSILQGIRALDGQAGRQAVGANSGWLAGPKGGADVVTRSLAWLAAAIAEELRIRRDMRHLRAMDDSMLKDIGLTRADIGTAIRYGRE